MRLRAVFSVLLVCSVVTGDAGSNREVDVFNKNFNRREHSAKNFVYRTFDVVPPTPEPSWKASATLTSDNLEQAMTGEITFKQWSINAPVLVSMNISGLPAGKHSVHIHAFGDVTDGCKSTGPHFRSSIIGNVEAKADKDVDVTYESFGINLFGLTGILGRSVVIHEKPSGEQTPASIRDWKLI
jgi:Cu/Zn superoxide dismutase